MLTLSFSTKYLVHDFENIIKLFPPGCDTFKINDYDEVCFKFVVLIRCYKGISSLLDNFSLLEMRKQVLPTIPKQNIKINV